MHIIYYNSKSDQVNIKILFRNLKFVLHENYLIILLGQFLHV